MAIYWPSDLVRCGLPAVDPYQLQFLATLNALHDSYRRANMAEQLLSTLLFLDDYGAHCFQAEETLMREHAYPELSQHRAEHVAFYRDVQAFKISLIVDGASERLAWRLYGRLCPWLVEHIVLADRKLGRFINGQTRHAAGGNPLKTPDRVPG